MKIIYTVFWLNTQRTVYWDDSYYTLGEWMKSFGTEAEAVDYIRSLELKKRNLCTIIKIYTGEND